MTTTEQARIISIERVPTALEQFAQLQIQQNDDLINADAEHAATLNIHDYLINELFTLIQKQQEEIRRLQESRQWRQPPYGTRYQQKALPLSGGIDIGVPL